MDLPLFLVFERLLLGLIELVYLFLNFCLFPGRWGNDILPWLFVPLLDYFFVLVELLVHLFGLHVLFELTLVSAVVMRLVLELGKVNLDFRSPKISVMIVFSDLLGLLGILKSDECKLSRLSILGPCHFAVSHAVSIAFEVFLNLFLRKHFGDVLQNNSAHLDRQYFYYNENRINNNSYNN